MKILFYYWSQYNDDEKRGGGIRVYLDNIIGELKTDEGIEIFTLNSGLSYDIKKESYITEVSKNTEVKQFEIVNSPMLSPGHNSFYNQQTYLGDAALKQLFISFLEEHGPFDVIHIHAMEGLTLQILEAKELFPDTKFYLSMHNYHIFCPQVNMWKKESVRCTNHQSGKDCLNCIPYLVSAGKVKKMYMLSTLLIRMGISPHSRLYGLIFRSGIFFYKKLRFMLKRRSTDEVASAESVVGNQTSVPEPIIDQDLLEGFARYREENVEYINKYVDRVFPVSKRVEAICEGFGIEKEKLKTLYIGTKFAEDQLYSSSADLKSDSTRIAFIGYMRKDKGFYYFLNRLEALPESLSEKLEIVIASRIAPGDGYARIQKLKPKFKKLIFHNGYTHDNLKEILEGVHVGIVPVLWEDNLPQVAIEFKALGIPVLASKLGGASELSSSEFFSFDVDNPESFTEKIEKIVEDKSCLNDYWKQQNKLITIPGHIQRLMEYYKE